MEEFYFDYLPDELNIILLIKNKELRWITEKLSQLYESIKLKIKSGNINPNEYFISKSTPKYNQSDYQSDYQYYERLVDAINDKQIVDDVIKRKVFDVLMGNISREYFAYNRSYTSQNV